MEQSNHPLVNFAASRIQERELFPRMSADLVLKIQAAFVRIREADREEVFPYVRQMLRLLEGVRAIDSLPILIGLLDQYPDIVRTIIGEGRGNEMRLRYFDRLSMLSDIFFRARIERIAETIRFIELGWGFDGD